MAIYQNVLDCLNEVCQRNFAQLKDPDGKTLVKAIGIKNQRETTVAWNRRTGMPLGNALVWLDSRTVDIVSRFKYERGDDALEEVRKRCGLPINTYFSAVKMRWLLENEP